MNWAGNSQQCGGAGWCSHRFVGPEALPELPLCQIRKQSWVHRTGRLATAVPRVLAGSLHLLLHPCRLIGGLASENIRWAESVEMFREQEKTLCGDVLLISAFVSYVGYFTKKYRAELMEKYWIPYLEALKVSSCGAPPGTSAPCPGTEGPALLGGQAPNVPPWQVPIPTTPGLDPLSLLTDAADVAAWSNQGLPSDRTSTENATILCNTQRWPLVVDAQLQGIKWIKNKYGGELKAIRLGQRRWVGGAGCPPPVSYRLCTPIRAKAPESNRGQGVLQGLAGGHLPKLTTSPPLPAWLQLPGHHRAGGF